MANPIDPSLVAMQVREVKAHDEVITALEEVKLKDLKGMMSASNDCKIRSWNLGLDLIGAIDMNTERTDP